jgi:tripartite-type tricarboxylate transporter receptor subunit TctC
MPDRPIELVVPYVQRGGSDQRARLVAASLEKHLGERIDVVNRTGAIVGHTAIATAPADGRTIGLITGEIGMMHWHEGLTGLTWRDYTPLAVPFVEAAAVIVAAEAPWRTLSEFLDACRTRRIRGSGGPNFGVWKFALAGLLDAVGCDLARLDWTETLSGEQGLENVLAGAADVAPITMTDARGALRDGRARALATMEDARHRQFPEVPTVREAVGVAWEVAHWRGFVAPPRLPDAIRDRYVDALRRVAADASFQAEAAASAFTVRWRFGDEFARYMEQDDRQFGRVIALLPPEASCMH